jgi:hypothetical protein
MRLCQPTSIIAKHHVVPPSNNMLRSPLTQSIPICMTIHLRSHPHHARIHKHFSKTRKPEKNSTLDGKCLVTEIAFLCNGPKTLLEPAWSHNPISRRTMFDQAQP